MKRGFEGKHRVVKEKRKFKRHLSRTYHTVIHLTGSGDVQRNQVVLRNISGLGICFRSPRPLDKDTEILIRIEGKLIDDLKENRAEVIKADHFVLARTVWNEEIPTKPDRCYDVGCSFVKMKESTREKIDRFISLMNHYTAADLGIQ